MKLDNKPIEFIALDISNRQYEDKDAFGFREDKKHHALQRAALWVLRKLGAYDLKSERTVTRRTINRQKIADAIGAQIDSLYNAGFTPDFIIMGADDYRYLVQDRDFIDYAIGFTVDLNLYPRPIMGLSIKIIPTMRGIVVIPKTENIRG